MFLNIKKIIKKKEIIINIGLAFNKLTKLKLSNKLNIETKLVFRDKNNEHHIKKIIKKLK